MGSKAQNVTLSILLMNLFIAFLGIGFSYTRITNNNE